MLSRGLTLVAKRDGKGAAGGNVFVSGAIMRVPFSPLLAIRRYFPRPLLGPRARPRPPNGASTPEERSMFTTSPPGTRLQRCRFVTRSLAAGALAAAYFTVPAADADTGYQFFQSPSGNISCQLGTFLDAGISRATAACQVGQHNFSTPPRPADCMGGWGDSVALTQGGQPSLQCHNDTLLGSSQPVLDYGQTRSVGPITCHSEETGITCTDSSTGHGFSLSRDGYKLS
jgi:hypothetical protein